MSPVQGSAEKTGVLKGSAKKLHCRVNPLVWLLHKDLVWVLRTMHPFPRLPKPAKQAVKTDMNIMSVRNSPKAEIVKNKKYNDFNNLTRWHLKHLTKMWYCHLADFSWHFVTFLCFCFSKTQEVSPQDFFEEVTYSATEMIKSIQVKTIEPDNKKGNPLRTVKKR